ncbi:hypothetical protein BJ508DRAFT_417790, partial [Ascobolus immersus RN42]
VVDGEIQRLITAKRSWDNDGCLTLDFEYAVERTSKRQSTSQLFFQRRVIVSVAKYRVITVHDLTRAEEGRLHKFMMPRVSGFPASSRFPAFISTGPSLSSNPNSSIGSSALARPTESPAIGMYSTDNSKKRKISATGEQAGEGNIQEPITPHHLMEEGHTLAFRMTTYFNSLAMPNDEREVMARRIQNLEKGNRGLEDNFSAQEKKLQGLRDEMDLMHEENKKLSGELLVLKGKLKQVVEVARDEKN